MKMYKRSIFQISLTLILVCAVLTSRADPSDAEARKQFTTALEKAATGAEKAAALIGIGGTFANEKNHSSARAAFEEALAIEGITPEQSAQALLRIASGYVDEKKDQPAIAALEKALTHNGVSNRTRLEAHILLGQTLLKYPWVFSRAREVFNDILKSPEITPEQRIAAQTSR